MKLATFFTVLCLLFITYLVQIRGLDVVPKVDPPLVLNSQGVEKTYSWKILSPMPTARSEAASAVFNKEIYVIGGRDAFGRTSKKVEVYHTLSDSWSTSANLPDGRHHARAVSVNNKIYVIGGFKGIRNKPQKEVFEFDPVAQTWKEMTSMPTPRGWFAIALYNDHVYTIGGVSQDGPTNTVEVFTPKNGLWDTISSMPIQSGNAIGAFINNRLYVVSGHESKISRKLTTLQIYDPSIDLWLDGTRIPSPRTAAAGTAFGEFLLVAGGEKAWSSLKIVDGYNTYIKEWKQLTNIPSPRHDATAQVVENTLYLIGGGKHAFFSVSSQNEALEILTR